MILIFVITDHHKNWHTVLFREALKMKVFNTDLKAQELKLHKLL